MNYKQCIEFLFSCHSRGIKLGLENIEYLAEKLQNPHAHLPAIHVAGTNGKGSVVTKIAAALTLSGYKVGLYTSPHISSFRERIRVNGRCISEEEVLHSMEKILATNVQATFFEYTTALAFDYFASQKVDFCVLETGLGGRLDATNICRPRLTVITSISLDHTQTLGLTCEEIAKEKAGIIKEGVPVVIGPRVPRAVIQERAAALHAPLYLVEGMFDDYEEENRAIAKTSLEILSSEILQVDPENITKGLEALPECRFQKVSKPGFDVILDVAHNPDGIEKLLYRLQGSFCVVCCFSKDKDVDTCLQMLVKRAEALFFTKADSPRAESCQELLRKCKELNPDKEAFAYDNLEKAMMEASLYAKQKKIPLLVCGTFFIMSACRKFLGFNEPVDEFMLN